MGIKINLTLPFDQELEKELKRRHPKMQSYRILAKSLDARGAPKGRKPVYFYQIEIFDHPFERPKQHFAPLSPLPKPPVIIGAGPAGLFCALRLLEHGIKGIICERGSKASERMRSIARFWRYGELDPEDNVCYGEGGAGLFSDGKLITRIKSPHIAWVMETFVRFGAPKEIEFVANPHLGSNKIRSIISAMSEHLISHGWEIRSRCRVDEIVFNSAQRVEGVKLVSGEEIATDHVILATGHSAKEMYQFLAKKNVAMENKEFAMGVRIEHPRRYIDALQYGSFCEAPELEAARYRLSYHNHTTERGSYSFCMCPGGYILSSGTDPQGIVVNGMSNSGRSSAWSNSALVVSTRYFDQEKPLLEGLRRQEEIEKKAYEISKELASGRELPAMGVEDFLAGNLRNKNLPLCSSPSKVIAANLLDILPTFIVEHLQAALIEFDKKMPGLISPKALLVAPETRTSAPVRLLRHHDFFESLSHPGLFPCGEGAGHAGGITSAAVDGVRIANAIVSRQG